MERTIVQSTNIASVGWEDGVLEIAFKGKTGKPETVYRYLSVPGEIFEAFLNSPTKGGYFAAHIRGIYPSSKI